MYSFKKETKHAEMREASKQRIAQMTIEERAAFWERIAKQWYESHNLYAGKYFRRSDEMEIMEEERDKWKIVAMSLGATEDAILGIILNNEDEEKEGDEYEY